MRISPTAVDCRTMRLLFYLLCSALMVGCTQKSTAPRDEGALPLLDNHGGFAHSGRRVTLFPDGSYSDTTYTDVVDAKSMTTTRGVYTLDADRTHLTLRPERGEVEHLYRVDYCRCQYWVHDQERHRITESKETWLRQTSLRAGAKWYLPPAKWIE